MLFILSSVGALIGIVGARLGFPVMDTVASLVICFFIGKAAYDIYNQYPFRKNPPFFLN